MPKEKTKNVRIKTKKDSNDIDPKNPISSEIRVKIKSVCFYGK